MNKKQTLVKGIVSYGSEFAITITLHPKMYHYPVIHQRNIIQGILNTLDQSNHCKMSLVVELTENFNVHLHGFIKIPLGNSNKSMQHQIKDLFRGIREVGFIKIEPITNDVGWSDYCLKQYINTKIEVGENPIIIDDCQRFTPLDIACYIHRNEPSGDGILDG